MPPPPPLPSGSSKLSIVWEMKESDFLVLGKLTLWAAVSDRHENLLSPRLGIAQPELKSQGP